MNEDIWRHHTPSDQIPKDDNIMTIFAGVWNVDLHTAIGKMDVVFDITDLDGEILGTAITDKETVEFIDAVAEGNRLTWTQKVTTPMKLTLKFEVDVEGDTMTGTAKAGILPASKLQGTRTSAH
jgi:hypothetical protein